VLGIDLGGTKSAALVTSEDGNILCRVAEPTPAAGGPDAIVPFLLDLARRALAKSPGPVAGVGVSAGAPTSARTGRVFPAPNLPGWPDEGVPLAEIVSRGLGGLPVFLDNDANATALAEHRFGAGRGARDMAFLTLERASGPGLIVDGRLARGAPRRAARSATLPSSTIRTGRARVCAVCAAVWRRMPPARRSLASRTKTAGRASRPGRP
jgi:glucokinase